MQAVPQAGAEKAPHKLYLSVWRWHFYAGLYVIPFMVMLALTGLVILFTPQIEDLQYRDRMFVQPQGTLQPYSAQLEAVRKAYPEATIQRFRPNLEPNRSSQVALEQGQRELTVFVNPYTLAVLGEVDNASRWENIATNIHGTLLVKQEVTLPLVGKVNLGDLLIEIAASLMVLLVVTGLYLWWPRNQQGVYGSLVPRLKARGRTYWKDLHSVPMFWVSLIVVFFAFTGLAWTGIWGDKYVQAWNTFPEQMWNDVPKSNQNLESLNRTGEKLVPWNLENSKLPLSGSMAGKDGIPAGTPVNLDTVIQYVRDNGVNYGFWVAMPRGKEGVWTVSASSMSRDVTDARKDRTLHIDQYSGKVLADIGWSQYSLGAKAMASGIALHMGTYGWWSQALNALFCLLILVASVAAVAMWWLRRPAGVFRLAAPPMPQNLPLWKGAVALIIAMSIFFPAAGATLLLVLVLDYLIIQRIPVLKQAIG
ncbi:MAG: membrane protein [Meiothermus sp.]|uniref:Membrane protein n=2 Tax=Meiothermus hypogaeus TaxID=884155 RepID=A0A511R560_9DEIN|nr:PepSY domain-containing protein [Meiothermus hypogaeus]RIH76511.1 PepSY-associated TM region [Meiothermus hypogaeus]GEM84741.1 membrane protein [Meiothermus hypogaeus NBRC 106114]GIW38418.1 MAG: membrane protein [Meiothermus sp.]